MRSRTPKLLHPLCGRPMIGWPIAAARAAGAGQDRGRRRPRRAAARSTRRRRRAWSCRSRPAGPRMRSAAAGRTIDPTRTVIVLHGDVPLISADTIAALAEHHAPTGRRRDDPDRRARGSRAAMAGRAGGRRHRRAGRRDQGGQVTRASSSWRSARSTPACYAFDGAALLAALRAGRQQQRAGRVLPAGRAADPARARAHRDRVRARGPVDETLGINDRLPAGGGARGRPAPDQRRAHARRRHDRRPGRHGDRRRRHDRRGHRDRAVHEPARRHRVGGARRSDRTARCIDATVGSGSTVLHSLRQRRDDR